jgi:hypothetical protein
MTGGANRFYNAIIDAGELRQTDLIGYFIYYLTVEAGESHATVSKINHCFCDCDLQVPSNTSARIAEHLRGSPPRFVKVNGGYRLHRAYRQEIAQRLGDLRVAFQTSETLRGLEAKFAEGGEKAFLSELISLF